MPPDANPLLTAFLVFLLITLPLLVALGSVWLVRKLGRFSDPGGQGSQDPKDILDRRYARGEISREQYRQMRDDIDS